jgi:hypothetical protein
MGYRVSNCVIKKPQRRRPRPDLGCRTIGWIYIYIYIYSGSAPCGRVFNLNK